MVFSKRAWDALSADDQALLRKLAGQAQAEERVLWNAYEKDAMDKARAAGIQIVETLEKKPFQDAVKPVWDKYGPRFAATISRIQAVQ
jgi:TRAP-type C4-dicarboxylate transport system substrate-binding protein